MGFKAYVSATKSASKIFRDSSTLIDILIRMISLQNDISQNDEIARRNIRSELLSDEKFSCLPATRKLSDLNLRGESYLKIFVGMERKTSAWGEKARN